MAGVIAEQTRTFLDPDSGDAKIAEYLKLKKAIDVMEKRRKVLYPEVMDYIDAEGYEDDKGNIILDLDAPTEGFTRVEKVLRTARPLDLEVAHSIIEAKSLHDDVHEMVEVLSEQKIMQAMQDDKLTADEVDAMYPVKTTYALTPKK